MIKHWFRWWLVTSLSWTNVDLVHWCIYAALRGDELSEGNSKPFWRYIYIYIYIHQKKHPKCVAPPPPPLPQRRWSIIPRQPNKSRNYQHLVCVCIYPWHTHLHRPSYPPIRGLQVSNKGVEKPLSGIKPNKLAGPNLMPCHFVNCHLSVYLY